MVEPVVWMVLTGRWKAERGEGEPFWLKAGVSVR